MFVYMIVCDADISPVTGTGKYYVGKHKSRNLEKYLRLQLRLAAKGSTDKPYLYNAMRKYPNPKDWRIHPLLSTLTADDSSKVGIRYWERELISLFNCQNRDVGYNLTEGGDGWTHTEETRRKIGLAHKGRAFSEETRRRMSESAKKRPHPPHGDATKRKIAQALSGKSFSPERKENLRLNSGRRGKAPWNAGKPWSEEIKQKMRDAKRPKAA